MRRRPSSHDSIPGSVPDVVQDAFFGGTLRLWQPVRGYRVNVDTLLLAAFAASVRPRARRVVDLGAGVGALALAYARLGTAAALDLVEREARLVALAERNLRASGATGSAYAVDLSVSGLPDELSGQADVVLSNPPFFEERASRARTADGARAARTGSLAPFIGAAYRALGRRATAFFAYPAASLTEFLLCARDGKLVAKRLKLVHAYATTSARLALVELRRAKPGGLVVDPPIIEWAAKGVRSSELEALVAGSPKAR